ncbi:MAG: GntG family PLP-dependent aldolase [Acidimicrobiia bacterium]
MTVVESLVDLRSDTVTQPTAAMRRAMADAEVGDDGYGEDPTVRRLEELAAGVLGKEAALFVPSGTMANQVALRVLGRPGTDVLCAARAHLVRYEAGATPRNAGVGLRGLDDADGLVRADVVAAALEDRSHHFPEVSLVAVENTHMPAHGRPWSAAEIAAVAGVARDAGLPVYCDGARLWNAAVALGVTPGSLVGDVDAVMCCLSKALAAPVGSVLAGSRAFVDAATVERKRLGGAMRQAGVLAAAGVVAVETMVERLDEDHRRARHLAEVLAEVFPGSVDPDDVRTNIVCARSDRLPAAVVDRLAERGVLAGTIDRETTRFVTHLDVDDVALARAADALHGLV